MDGMLTLKEVMEYLDLAQAEVERLVKKRTLNAYKIGGTYLRFKKDQVMSLKARLKEEEREKSGWFGKVRDLWYFNRIYILSSVLCVLIFYFIMH